MFWKARVLWKRRRKVSRNDCASMSTCYSELHFIRLKIRKVIWGAGRGGGGARDRTRLEMRR